MQKKPSLSEIKARPSNIGHFLFEEELEKQTVAREWVRGKERKEIDGDGKKGGTVLRNSCHLGCHV